MWALKCNLSARVTVARCKPKLVKPAFQPNNNVKLNATSTKAAPLAPAPVAEYEAIWDAFSGRVQGEWEGVTVTFNSDGAPQPLPERFVPGAYREWGVQLFDWQSQSSCVVNPNPDSKRSVRNIFKRLMPTVGCEADAIAYEEEAEDVWHTDGGSPVKPVTPSGGYVAAPAQLPQSGGRAKVEVCLAPREGKTRLRANLTLMQHWESKQWQIVFVELSRETYDGPFNGGVELSGCAGGGKPFAKDPAVTAQQLAGDWQAATVLRYMRHAEAGSLELEQSAKDFPGSVSTMTGPGATFLPAGTWVGCKASSGDVDLEVGLLRSDDERDVVCCKFVSGRLDEVVFANECKTNAGKA